MVALAARAAMHGAAPMTGKLMMSVTFYLGNHRRVDCDNLNKAVSDAMQGIVFADDSQVCDLSIIKNGGCDTPGVSVHVEEL
jgi:Holliday junction resolvase RusA-like endonuclease